MEIPSFMLSESNRQARGSTKSNLWHVRSVRRQLMFQRSPFLEEENVRIERTADVTGRRSPLIGRAIRKLGGQMFTQIFTPMTWHNSSGSCTRGVATCAIWLFDRHAARIMQSNTSQFSTSSQDSSRSCSKSILRAVRGSTWELLVAQTEAHRTHTARIVLRRQHLFNRPSTIIQDMLPQSLEPF